VHHSLIDDAETEPVAVGGGEVSAQRTDARHRAGLGPDVAAGKLRLHAPPQRAVLTGDGKSRQEVVIDIAILEGIAQKAHLQLCRDIVVERQPGAVGKLIPAPLKAELVDKLPDYRPCAFGRGRPVARRGGNLIEHGLGVEVVTLLEHAHHDLVDGVETTHDAVGLLGLALLADGAGDVDAHLAQLVVKAAHKLVLAQNEEG